MSFQPPNIQPQNQFPPSIGNGFSGNQGPGGAPQEYWRGPYRPPQRTTNILAVGGLLLSAVSVVGTFLFWFMMLPVSILGLMLSIIGLRQIKSDAYQTGTELAWIGIVINGLALLGQLVLLVMTLLLFGALGFLLVNAEEICESDPDCVTTETTR